MTFKANVCQRLILMEVEKEQIQPDFIDSSVIYGGIGMVDAAGFEAAALSNSKGLLAQFLRWIALGSGFRATCRRVA